jgi:hypothetical protein
MAVSVEFGDGGLALSLYTRYLLSIAVVTWIGDAALASGRWIREKIKGPLRKPRAALFASGGCHATS